MNASTSCAGTPREDGRLTLKPYLKGGRGRQGRRKARELHIERTAIDALKRWRRIQLEERFAAGKAWQHAHRLAPDGKQQPNLFVFTYTNGQPVQPLTFQRWFDRLVARSTVTRLTPHGMRHSHAAILLRNGWQMHDVSARLGHAASTVTESTYAHIDTSRAPRAPRLLAEALAAHGVRARNRAYVAGPQK